MLIKHTLSVFLLCNQLNYLEGIRSLSGVHGDVARSQLVPTHEIMVVKRLNITSTCSYGRPFYLDDMLSRIDYVTYFLHSDQPPFMVVRLSVSGRDYQKKTIMRKRIRKMGFYIALH